MQNSQPNNPTQHNTNNPQHQTSTATKTRQTRKQAINIQPIKHKLSQSQPINNQPQNTQTN